MVVRNIYVSDKEYFLEFLIRDLIKYGISYCLVKEADEVHFDNYIIRFHTKVNETDNLDDLLRTLMEIDSNTRDFFISENENNRKTSLITGESYLMLESLDEQSEQKKRAEGKPYQKKINFYRGGKAW